MSEGPAEGMTVLVGGHGGLRFALPMAQVRRVVGSADLPARHRRVSLPRLFDEAPPSADQTRFAEVEGGAEPTFVEVGADVRVASWPPEGVEPVPPVLAKTAARWGWKAILGGETGYRVLVDPSALAPIAAPRTGTPATAGPGASEQRP